MGSLSATLSFERGKNGFLHFVTWHESVSFHALHVDCSMRFQFSALLCCVESTAQIFS